LPLTILQILDLLLVLVLALFVPIGLWRGALREWLALAGITFGLMLANVWARPWGGDVAVAFALDQKLATFAVAALFFLGTTLLIGYGSGIALPFRPDLTWTNRLLGALLSFGNGVLILSGTLGIMQRFLFDDRAGSPLVASGLSSFLIGGVGWAYLGILAVLGCCVLIGLGRRWSGEGPLLEEYGPRYRTIPREARATAATWDIAPPPVETWGDPTPVPESPAPARETMVLKFVPPRPTPHAAPEEVAPSPAFPAPSANTARGPHVIDLTRPSQRPQPPPPEVPPPNVTTLAAHAEARESGRRDRLKDAAPIAATETPTVPPHTATTGEAGLRCGVCGTVAAPRARFCLTCGHIIGTPERRQVARQQ